MADVANITIAVKRTIKNRVTLCQANNISTEGILIGYKGKGTEENCWLEFCLPNSKVPIKAKGKLLQSVQHGDFILCVYQFVIIAPSHKRLIEDYVKQPEIISEQPQGPFICVASEKPARLDASTLKGKK